MISMILANVLAPYVAWGVGGDSGLSLPFSMLATTFAALIERRFYKTVGFATSSLRYSTQANVVSWFVGVVIAYMSLMLRLEAIFALMYFLAIPFSIVIEGWYLSRSSKHLKPKWRPIVVGNVLSGLLLYAIVFTGLEFGDRLQRARSPSILLLTEYREIIHWTVAISCLLFFCLSFRPTNGSSSIEIERR